jgi:hypothetical protein
MPFQHPQIGMFVGIFTMDDENDRHGCNDCNDSYDLYEQKPPKVPVPVPTAKDISETANNI